MLHKQFVSMTVGLCERSDVSVYFSPARRMAGGGEVPDNVHVRIGEELSIFGEPETVLRVLREALLDACEVVMKEAA